MRLISSSFNKISVDKKKELTRDTSLTTDMKIIDIKKEKSSLFKDEDLLEFHFQFTIDYAPDFALIIFEGKLVLLMDKSEEISVNQIIDDWKEKNLNNTLKIHLLQMVFSRCSLKAMQLEEFVNLPTHIPITPKITNPEAPGNEENKEGKESTNSENKEKTEDTNSEKTEEKETE
tara:strand:+ start:2064 stop:2588 length:525 start_codon:yes stop_codon:yes gene_type:complete